MGPLGQFLPKREVIGQAECPLLYRWTLLKVGHMPHPNRGELVHSRAKVMLHHFLPESRDRDVHDHPWQFVTVVLKGYYDDVSRCPVCKDENRVVRCVECGGRGFKIERMKAGMVRYRPTTHAHQTYAGPNGCWTLVIAGPIERMWGFFIEGKWLPWHEYEDKYGSGMRCDD